MEENWLFVFWFENDPRNLRLRLAIDGMNPYGNLSSKHSVEQDALMSPNPKEKLEDLAAGCMCVV